MSALEIRPGRVAIIEDDSLFRTQLFELVTFCQHEVVLEAATALSAIEQITNRVNRLGELMLDGVLLDGNLESGGLENTDGTRVAQHIRTQPGGDKVFIVSMSNTGVLIPGADIKIPKIASHDAVRRLDSHIKENRSRE